MTDLFVLTADADMQAVMKAILARHASLGIREISFKVDRHTGHDSGMIKDGPEIAYKLAPKQQYSRLMLMWDHDGSGYQRDADSATEHMQRRLASLTWSEQSISVAIVPELEEWLAQSSNSIGRHLKVQGSRIDELVDGFRRKAEAGPGPKECLEYVFRKTVRRSPRPQDFAGIAETATLSHWMKCRSFKQVVDALRRWFPVGG